MKRKRLKVTLLIDFGFFTPQVDTERLRRKLMDFLQGENALKVDEALLRWTTMSAERKVSK